jgi:hypothetical protein
MEYFASSSFNKKLIEFANRVKVLSIFYVTYSFYNNMNYYYTIYWFGEVLVSPQCHHEPFLRANRSSEICILLLYLGTN